MSPRTQESYVGAVYYLARYHRKAPDLLSDEELKNYLYRLAERKLAASTLNIATSSQLGRQASRLGSAAAVKKGIMRCETTAKVGARKPHSASWMAARTRVGVSINRPNTASASANRP
mgnify:CR=1 FL=1